MLEYLIKNKVTTTVLVLVFVVLGIFSSGKMITEYVPKMEVPLAMVRVVYPGAAPADLENQVVKKVEDAISEVSMIDQITSYVYENYALILVEFDFEADVDIKAMEMKDKIETILSKLPDGAERPIVAKFNPTTMPVAGILLTGKKDLKTLYEYADKNLKDRFTVIEGVSQVNLTGGLERQINIKLDNMAMERNYVTLADVIRDISCKNINIPGGSIERDGNNINVRMVGEFDSIAQVGETRILTSEGKTILLSDIAEVEDGNKRIEKISGLNGEQAVFMTVMRQSGADMLTIAREVRREVTELQADLPDGMELTIGFEFGESIENMASDSYREIILGIFLAFVILYVFLGNIRAALIASAVIPTSIVSTVFLMQQFGFSFNMLTFMAFTTSIGTLIANALVVIENIEVHFNHSRNRIKAAIEGTREVTMSVIASAGTNLVVFTPIALIGGVAGSILVQFGLTVVFATLFSLIASFSLTPMLCAAFLTSDKENRQTRLASWFSEKVHRVLDWLLAEYALVFRVIMKYRKITMAVIAITFLASLMLTRYIGGEMMAKGGADVMSIKVQAPAGSTAERTYEICNEIALLAKKDPDVERSMAVVGTESSDKGQVIVKLLAKKIRSRETDAITRDLIPELAKIPGAEIAVQDIDLVSGNSDADISIDFYGYDYDRIKQLTDQAVILMKDSGFFETAIASYRNPALEFRFIPNEKKMSTYGLKNAAVGILLRAAVNGNDDSVYRENGYEYNINNQSG